MATDTETAAATDTEVTDREAFTAWAVALAAVFVALVAVPLWPWRWTLLPAGWPQSLASALLGTSCLAPLLWRLRRAPAGAHAPQRPSRTSPLGAHALTDEVVVAGWPELSVPDATEAIDALDPLDPPPDAPDAPEASTASDLPDLGLETGATRDPLALLPTRTELMARLQQAIDARRHDPGRRFALLFLDVDHMRGVNESLGHEAGDELLQRLGVRLQQGLRPDDAVARVPAPVRCAGRVAGDEFLVLLDGVDGRAEVSLVAERLLEALSQPLQIGRRTLMPSLSIGIVLAPAAAASAEQALHDCDTALIEAKRCGRARVAFFDVALQDRVAASLALETDMRRALQRGELFLLYQPLVELASHRLVGVEALLRWRHPQRDVLLPAEFFGVAEACGLADEIGHFALQAACRQFSRWRRELGTGAPPLISVNLAAAQLQIPGMVDEVEAALLDNGMQPHELQIDVIDGPALQERPLLAALRALNKLGVKLAIDDFGLGTSSLASLHRLPFHTVKIDPSFVSRAHQVEHHRVLIEATVRVARSRGMSVLAEGIETAAQAALMARMECELGQGWFYGHLLRADDLASWEAPPLAMLAA